MSTKPLYGLPSPDSGQLDKLTENQLDSLEWAKEFLASYERKRGGTDGYERRKKIVRLP